MMHSCFVLFLVCLYVCVCECLLHNNLRMYTSNQYSNIRGPLRECRSIRSGASGLPYYCAPLVCVSAVIESLAVWRHNKPKTRATVCRCQAPSLDLLWCIPHSTFTPTHTRHLESLIAPNPVSFNLIVSCSSCRG